MGGEGPLILGVAPSRKVCVMRGGKGTGGGGAGDDWQGKSLSRFLHSEIVWIQAPEVVQSLNRKSLQRNRFAFKTVAVCLPFEKV